MLKEIITSFSRNKLKYMENVDLEEFSNSKTGGIVPLMIYPHNVEQLKYILKILDNNKQKKIVLGNMTNVVIASGKLDYAIINMSEFITIPKFDEENQTIEVSAGYKMKDLAQWALKNSLSGLQWMEGIPGTVGAGSYMNAGFLPGQDFQSHLVSATVLMPDFTVQIIKNKEMGFSYRRSILQKNGGIVLSVSLLIRRGKKWKIAIRMNQYHRRRARHQPLSLPSAGTVFVPPTPYHVGGILPKLGLVGYKVGGAQVSKKSPGFIVGIDNMTGEDYYKLVKLIQKKVLDQYGIELEPEVRLLGFKSSDENK